MVWERDRLTEGEEDRLLYWTIISTSLDYTTPCYLRSPTWHFCFSARESSTGGCCGSLSQWGVQPLTSASATGSWDSKTAADCNCFQLWYPPWASAYITSLRLGFLIDHVTVFVFFHRCVLFMESLIDSLVKSQYAILWHCNKWFQTPVVLLCSLSH